MAAKADDPSKVWTLADIVKRGEKVYAANCAACHQANGKGAGPIKPLDGSAVVLDADKNKQIAVVAQWSERTLPDGQTNVMPAWKQLERHRHCGRHQLHQEQLVQQDRPGRAAG